MAKDSAIETSFSFAGGLNTEASDLNYPANSSFDELNFDLKRNGNREKRLGMDKRSTDAYSSAIYTSPDSIAIQSYLWENIGAGSEEVVHVIQIGRYLYFYARNIASSTIVSAAGPTSIIDLSTYSVASDVELYKVQFAEDKGYLIVAGRVIDPFYLSYDFDNRGVFEVPTFVTGGTSVALNTPAGKDVGAENIVYDSIGEQVAIQMQEDVTGGNHYLYVYDESDGSVNTITISNVTGNNLNNGILFWSTGDSGTTNNRLLFYSGSKISIFNTADWSQSDYSAPAFGVFGYRETNDFVVYTDEAGTDKLKAWQKSEGVWQTIYNQNVPSGYTHEGFIADFTGRNYVLCLAKKISTNELAAYQLTPSVAGGGSPTANDWGITSSTISGMVHDSTDDVVWTMANVAGATTLIKTQVDGTLISTRSLGVSWGAGKTNYNKGNNIIYDENTHSIYISSQGSIYAYDIANDNFYDLNTVITTSGNLQFSNKYGKLYEGLTDLNDTQALVIHSVATEQPVIDNSITLQIRDLEGVEDGLANDARISTLSAAHEYNLRNQGWPYSSNNVENPGRSNEDGSSTADPVAFTRGEVGWYPSNGDQIQLGKATNVDKPWRLNYYHPDGLFNTAVGNTQAPRGRFIYNAFNVDRSNGKTTLTSLPASFDKSTNERPSTVAFYAGRSFYAGVNDEGYNDKVYFSQVLENINFIGKCYQDADPTSENISDLVATDGGVIPIAGAKAIVLLKVVEDSLIVGATNGIWQIKGSAGAGFSATDYQVIKISSNGIRNPHSGVDAEGTFAYWSDGGIYAIVPDEQTGTLRDKSLSIDTIQTYYNDITAEGKESAVGHYDNTDKKIIWLYKDSVESYSVLNKALFYDPLRQAFYPYEFESGTDLPRVVGIDNYIIGTNTAGTYNVVTGEGDTVTSASGTNDVVIITEGLAKDIEKSVHYLSIWPDGTDWDYTYSDITDTDFKDWADTGSDYYYDAYVETGYKINNDIVRAKQTPYIGVACERTETNWSFADDGENYLNPSSCKMSTQWDFYENTASNKWSDPYQVYRFRRYVAPIDDSSTFDNLYPDIVVTKNKVRGRGKALRLKFEAEDGKDLKLLGWQIFWSGNTVP